jgi:hypothetical protein
MFLGHEQIPIVKGFLIAMGESSFIAYTFLFNIHLKRGIPHTPLRFPLP